MKHLLKRIIPKPVISFIKELLKLPLKVSTRYSLNRTERRTLRTFRMAAFPETPIFAYAVGKIADTLGIKFEAFSPWEQYDVVLAFQDNTHAVIDVASYLQGAYDYTHRPPIKYIKSKIS